jgi:HEAT repeat protein
MTTAIVGTLLVPFSVIFHSLLEKRKSDSIRASAACGLAPRGYVEAVGPLAGCLFDSSAEVRLACAEALHAVLPELTESDYGSLGAESIDNLGRALTDLDVRLVSKALDALEKVGTSHAIPHVEKLLKNTRSTLTRDRAQQVLEVLNERKHREAAGKDLLRAARSPEGPSALLRPATTAAESEVDQLLRASGESLN